MHFLCELFHFYLFTFLSFYVFVLYEEEDIYNYFIPLLELFLMFLHFVLSILYIFFGRFCLFPASKTGGGYVEVT